MCADIFNYTGLTKLSVKLGPNLVCSRQRAPAEGMRADSSRSFMSLTDFFFNRDFFFYIVVKASNTSNTSE